MAGRQGGEASSPPASLMRSIPDRDSHVNVHDLTKGCHFEAIDVAEKSLGDPCLPAGKVSLTLEMTGVLETRGRVHSHHPLIIKYVWYYRKYGRGWIWC